MAHGPTSEMIARLTPSGKADFVRRIVSALVEDDAVPLDARMGALERMEDAVDKGVETLALRAQRAVLNGLTGGKKA